MNEQNRKLELLGKAPVPKALLALGIPSMIGMLVNTLYNVVDAYFVGGLGERQVGAITVAFPLGQVVLGLGLLYGSGAASYIARLLGHGDKEKADKVASTALYSSLATGLAAIILSVVFLSPILRLLGATDGIMPYATSYASIYIISCIFSVFNVTMGNIISSEGAAKVTMIRLIIGAVLNAGLAPLFIYSFHLGVTGAAIATALSQVISSGLFLLYIFQKKSVFRFRIQDCTFSKDIVSEIFKIGIPVLIFQILTSASITLINQASAQYGDAAIAGMGVVTRLIAMGSMTVFGFIKGFQPIAGYSYGSKNFKRLREVTKLSVLWSTVFCVILGAVFFLFPREIVSAFTAGNQEMLSVGAAALRISSVSFIVFGYYSVYSSLFLALGKGKEGFFLGALRQGICFIPVISIFPAFWGINGVFFAQPAADVLSALITALMAVRLSKELAGNESASASQTARGTAILSPDKMENDQLL
ncbi:MATE family efflux transporter [Lactovum odontotermitis]